MAASYSLECRAASAACAQSLSYTARVFASDRFNDDHSITIARVLALLQIDSEAGHFCALVHDARRAC